MQSKKTHVCLSIPWAKQDHITVVPAGGQLCSSVPPSAAFGCVEENHG